MTQFDAPLARPANAGITNGLEIAAYALAQAIKLAVVYFIGHIGILRPIYSWALHNGSTILVFGVSTAFAVVWAVLAAILFFVLRAAFGGVPASVSRNRGAAIGGAEIGAFALAYVIAYIVAAVVNGMLLASLYASLPPSTLATTVMVVSLTVSVASAITVFLLFIGLRRAFVGR